MKTLTFKTNIMCSGCIARVTPVLDKSIGHGKWSVNILDPKKLLTVESELDPSEITNLIKAAGYVAEPV